MSESKVVHFNSYRPENSLFKQRSDARAEVQTIVCSNSGQCQRLTRKECSCRKPSAYFCPYGRFSREVGPTRRAKAYHPWCNNQEKTYKGVLFLETPRVLAIVGEFVYMPYAFMDMLGALSWKGSFLPKEELTVDNVVKLVEYKPKTMFGAEITGTRKKYGDSWGIWFSYCRKCLSKWW